MVDRNPYQKTIFSNNLNFFFDRESPFREVIRLLTEESNDIVYIQDREGVFVRTPGIRKETPLPSEKKKTAAKKSALSRFSGEPALTLTLNGFFKNVD